MIETEEMMKARHQQQEETASDPAVVANMSRHMAALSLLLAGRRGRERQAPEPNVQAGFRLTVGERDLVMAAATRLGTDVIHLSFDVEAATERPIGIAVFRIEGEEIACYSRCALWLSAGGKRAVVIPINEDAPCHFIVRRDEPLAKVEGWPARKMEAGIRRGANALSRLADSSELERAADGAYRQLVTFNGPGDWSVKTSQLAA